MARRAPVLLSVAILAFGLLALNQAFVAGPNQPALRGQEAAVAGAVLAALPAAPALATDQYTDSFSKVDAIVIFIPIISMRLASPFSNTTHYREFFFFFVGKNGGSQLTVQLFTFHSRASSQAALQPSQPCLHCPSSPQDVPGLPHHLSLGSIAPSGS